jgi:hypothetical protein
MAMNFVTFNQDYSCLAVGKLSQRQSVNEADEVALRYLERVPPLSYRPVSKVFH